VQIQKSKRRKIFTFQSGVLNAKEVRKKCSQDAAHPVMCSDELSRLVKPHQRYAYDLVVHVGLARYLYGKQREEIRAELYQQRGVTLSDGSISLILTDSVVSILAHSSADHKGQIGCVLQARKHSKRISSTGSVIKRSIVRIAPRLTCCQPKSVV